MSRRGDDAGLGFGARATTREGDRGATTTGRGDAWTRGVDAPRDAERAGLLARGRGRSDADEDDASAGRGTRGRWMVATKAIALACCAFAAGATTGDVRRGSRDAREMASVRAEAAMKITRALGDAGTGTPALGLSQYERDLARAKTAENRALRRAPRPPTSARTFSASGTPRLGRDASNATSGARNATTTGYPSEDDEDAYGDEQDGYSDETEPERDERLVIKGVETVLERTRERLIDADTEDESVLGYYRLPTMASGKIAFVSETNIWIASADGGVASRLSSTYSREGVPRLSPDGSHIAFLGLTYDGYDVFVAPTDGGVATQVTFGGKTQDIADWPEDNEILLISTAFSKSASTQLVTLNPDTRAMSPLPFARAIEGVKESGGCYVFVPLRQTSSTKRYEGGEQSRLWRWCRADSEAKPLTPEETWGVRGAWSPSVSVAKGLENFIFFISDKSGVANVWSMTTDGEFAMQLTNECLFDVQEFTVDGDVLVYRRGGSLYRRAISAHTARAPALGEEVELTYSLVSEFRKTMPTEIEDPYSSISELVLTNDGAFAAFVIRGQVFHSALVPFLGTRVEKVTRYSGAVRYKHIQFVNDASSDGQPKLLALSDASGEYEYVLLERQIEGGPWRETKITTGGKIKGAMEFSSISPDNTALLLADTDGNLKLVNLTETAVNTALYRTTEPEPISAKLAKRQSKPGRPDASLAGPQRPKPMLGRSPAARRAARRAARVGRRVSGRRASLHLASIGLGKEKSDDKASSVYADIDGIASIDTMLNGFRPEGVYGLAWSPDSSYIAFAKDEENDFSSIHVLNVTSGESTRITTPSYNAHSPKFSPDGLYLYYFSDQQIASGGSSPYGARGAEPMFYETSRLMCVPLRIGMTCPFFIGDELNPEGSVFDAEFGKALPTMISTKNIEQRAQVVPDLPEAQYLGFNIIGDGSGMLLTLVEDDQVIVAVYSMYSRQILPLYPDPMAVVVSGDMQVFTLVTEQGVALLSAKGVLQPGLDQESALRGAEVWYPPDTFGVIVNPREEWLQMYEEAMRNMRDAFYDPKLHGVDWTSITDRYRPLVYKISAKGELRDILAQAFGELSALHVFVSVHSDDPVLPLGSPSACLGANFEMTPLGLKIAYIHESSGILEAPQSSLSRSSLYSHVKLQAGDIIAKIDGVLVNSTELPLSNLLRGKAGMQVLLEVIKSPRSEQERKDEEDLQKMKELRMMQQMMGGGMGMASSQLGGASTATKTLRDPHMASLVRKHATPGAPRLPLGQPRHSVGPLKNGDVHADAKLAGKEHKGDDENEQPAPTTEMIIVMPLTLEECDVLEAADAVVQKREYVKSQTNDDVAYVYLEDMEQEGRGSSNSFDDFAAQFYPNVRKKGLIIDVRRNAGGNIDTWLLERLRRVAWMFDTERSGAGDTTMQYTFRGKVVVLIDEQTSSDAEMFALGIQQLGIGPVIGERTWGGAIGYSGHPELRLVDGSGFTIPSFGPYINGDWAIEQKGVTPDVLVSNLPVATFHGKDAQLDAAIASILDLMGTESVELPPKPTYPNRAFDSTSCAAGETGVDSAYLVSTQAAQDDASTPAVESATQVIQAETAVP